jgi:hypothetical protein
MALDCAPGGGVGDHTNEHLRGSGCVGHKGEESDQASSVSKIFTMVYCLITIGVFIGVVSKLAQAMLARSKHAHG